MEPAAQFPAIVATLLNSVEVVIARVIATLKRNADSMLRRGMRIAHLTFVARSMGEFSKDGVSMMKEGLTSWKGFVEQQRNCKSMKIASYNTLDEK